MKQETHEEVLIFPIMIENGLDYLRLSRKIFEKGVKWQMERSYSEEEVLELLLKMNEWPTTFDGEEEVKEWFEQFKK